jgi:hypothetical protein
MKRRCIAAAAATPVVYLYLDRFRLWIAARRSSPAATADTTAVPAE